MDYRFKEIVGIVRRIYADINGLGYDSAPRAFPGTEELIDSSLVAGTRGYIVSAVSEVNVSFEQRSYNSSAAMLRRLLAILIFEVYDAQGRVSDLRKPGHKDKYLDLSDLIKMTCKEHNDALSPKSKAAMESIRVLGNVFLHNWRVSARESDIKTLRFDLRIMIEEMVSLIRKQWDD